MTTKANAFIEGIHGRPIPRNHPVALQFPLGLPIPGKGIVVGYSCSGLDQSYTGLWVAKNWDETEDLERIRIEEIEGKELRIRIFDTCV